MLIGRLFHTDGAATENALEAVTVLQRGTVSKLWSHERSDLTGSYLFNSSHRYFGSDELRTLKVIVATLNMMYVYPMWRLAGYLLSQDLSREYDFPHLKSYLWIMEDLRMTFRTEQLLWHYKLDIIACRGVWYVCVYCRNRSNNFRGRNSSNNNNKLNRIELTKASDTN